MIVSAHPKTYQLYGLTLTSTVPLPELAILPHAPVSSVNTLRFEMTAGAFRPCSGSPVMTMTQPDGSLWLSCAKTEEGYRLCFPDLAEFVVDRTGGLVTCVAGLETPPETIRHLFLDQVLPLVLNLRGCDALHASAVLTQHGVCAFIGPTGRGKSTLAASFHQDGCPVLADDCLVLSRIHEPITVETAYSGLRLWADALKALYDSDQPLQPVSHYTSKRRLPAPRLDMNPYRTYPLSRIYSLHREDTNVSAVCCIAPLTFRDSVMELLAYTFRLDLSDRAMLHRQLLTFEQVAAHVPLKRLVLPSDLSALPAVRAAIIKDLVST
jgi:hypothetical protein